MKKIFRNFMAFAIAAMAFTACEDVPAPYDVFYSGGNGEENVVDDAKGTGTIDDPFNAAAANAYAKSLGTAESPEAVYIKGKVVSIKEQFGTQYGNATFYISDDGTEAGQFYVFRTLYLGNKKYESGTLLNIGDEVIIYGKVTNYQGNTPETVQNESYLYSLNGKTEGGGDNPNPQPTNESSKDNPFTVAKALEVARSLSSSETVANVYVKGVVVEFVSFDASYHNSRYYIADAANATDRLYIFDGKGLDNADLNAADDIKVGDEVIVYGTLSNYQGTTPEMNRGNYLVYHNGNGGNDNPNPGQGGEVSGNTLTVTFSSMGFDNAQELTSITLSDGTTLTFDKGNNSNTPKYYNSGAAIRLYPSNYFIVKASKKIANIVLTCSSNNAEGQVTASPGTVNADGMTISVNSINANTVQINNAHTGTGATSQLRIGTLAITYAE